MNQKMNTKERQIIEVCVKKGMKVEIQRNLKKKFDITALLYFFI